LFFCSFTLKINYKTYIIISVYQISMISLQHLHTVFDVCLTYMYEDSILLLNSLLWSAAGMYLFRTTPLFGATFKTGLYIWWYCIDATVCLILFFKCTTTTPGSQTRPVSLCVRCSVPSPPSGMVLLLSLLLLLLYLFGWNFDLHFLHTDGYTKHSK